MELSAKTHHFTQASAPRSFRLVTLVVISPRPCSAATTCDSVCVHTTATNNIYLKSELKVTQPHIRRFDTQQLPCPRAHNEPCGIGYPRLWFAVVAYFANISTSGGDTETRTRIWNVTGSRNQPLYHITK